MLNRESKYMIDSSLLNLSQLVQ